MAADSDQEFRAYVRQWLYAYHAYRLPMLEYWFQPFAWLMGWLLVALGVSGSISLWFVARALFGHNQAMTWIVWAAVAILFVAGIMACFMAYAGYVGCRQARRADSRVDRDISGLPPLDWASRATLVRLMNPTNCRISRAQFREELAEVEQDASVLREWHCLQSLRRLAYFGTRRLR